MLLKVSQIVSGATRRNLGCLDISISTPLPLLTLPLVNKLSRNVKQCWYADDASAGGELQHIKVWWDGLTQMGPQYGYFPNPEKAWLVVKEEHYSRVYTTI